MRNMLKTIKDKLEHGQSLVLVTVIASSGATPRGAGARMLIGKEGRICGTIGGGAVEYRSEQIAAKVLEERTSFGHDFTYVRIHSPVRMCGSLRDVRKKACFLVRDKTQCAQIYCKNDVADYKKEIHGYKKWELFSILFIIPYLCRVFHADTSVRGVWESGKYIYIEKTFTWRFVLGTLKLRKFLTLPQTKQQ